MESVRILNVDIQNITESELLQRLNSGVLYTPNLDHLIKLQKDREFYNAYTKAEWVVCDSRILHLTSKLLPKSIKQAIPGSSFFKSFYMHHKDDADCRIFLLGAKEGVGAKAMENINAAVNREIVVGAHSPSFGFEENEEECQEIIETINATNANVLLVGLGAPKQEKWIAKYRHRLNNIKIFLALGATIDFEANSIKRAPKIWQKLCLEWLYRFFREPKRLFKRYFIDDTMFFWLFLKQLIGIYKNPFN